jgi:hypothetical protein
MWAMIRRVGAAIIAPLLVLTLAGCSDDPGGTAADGPPPNPLFYEIASADGTVEGWMLGTIHALPDGARWQTPAIGSAIGEADLLVVELMLGDAGARHKVLVELATTPGLPPLAERVPPDLRPQLAALIDRGDVASVDFSTQETWALAIMLAGIDAPGDASNGVDRAMIGDFTGRPVRELEGLRGQLSIFDRLPEPQQRVMLASVVRESENTRRDPERLQRAWLAGDAATIEAATREGFLADPLLREALLTARNRRWAEALAPMLEQPPRPLIAVGAAHLVGPDGLVALLKARGYRLRRIP